MKIHISLSALIASAFLSFMIGCGGKSNYVVASGAKPQPIVQVYSSYPVGENYSYSGSLVGGFGQQGNPELVTLSPVNNVITFPQASDVSLVNGEVTSIFQSGATVEAAGFASISTYLDFGGVGPKGPAIWVSPNYETTFLPIGPWKIGVARGIGASGAVGYVASDITNQDLEFGEPCHAAIWPTPFTSFVDLNPGNASSSLAECQVGPTQFGMATINGNRHAGSWQGTAASFTDLNPSGISSSALYCAAGPYAGGYVTVNGIVHAASFQGKTYRDLAPGEKSQSVCLSISGSPSLGYYALSSDNPSPEQFTYQLPFLDEADSEPFDTSIRFYLTNLSTGNRIDLTQALISQTGTMEYTYTNLQLNLAGNGLTVAGACDGLIAGQSALVSFVETISQKALP